MNPPPGKKILGIGILKEESQQDPTYDPERVKREVDEEFARLQDSGFEMTLYFADSKAIEQSMPAIRQHLRSASWDGVSIGFGIRGEIEYTALFEEIVNAVVTESKGPIPKFMFTSSTTDIYNAVVRVMGA